MKHEQTALQGSNGRLVSVVIPTRDRAPLLARCLESLLDQDLSADRYEIVVVNNGSTDDTTSVIEQTGRAGHGVRVREVAEPEPGLNRARNRGITAARGELIWFIDDDELAPPDTLGRLIACLEASPGVAAVGGPCEPLPYGISRRPWTFCDACWATFKSWRAESGTEPAEVEELPGGNALFLRRAFDQVGMFAPHLSGSGDDAEWFHRARRSGARFLLDPQAWVWHRIGPEEITVRALARKRLGAARALNEARRTMGVERSVRGDLVRAGRFAAHGVRRMCPSAIVNALGWSLSASLGRRERIATRD